jgi:hypothetical protein
LYKPSCHINFKTEVQSEFYIFQVERDWCLDISISFFGEVFSLFTYPLVVSVLCSSPIIKAGWLSWCDPGSVVIWQKGFIRCIRPLGWDHSFREALVSCYVIHPGTGLSFIQTDENLLTSH